MSWFQNPFTQEFRGALLLGDRAHIPNFICPRNNGRGDDMVVSWKDGPFNLSGTDSDGSPASAIIIKYSCDFNNGFKAWNTLSVTLTTGAASTSAVTVREVIDSMNQNVTFTSLFTASLDGSTASPKILIRQKQSVTKFKFYVQNGKGEAFLGFNDRAGIAELPTYFNRHVVSGTSSDCQGLLIALNMVNNVDQDLVRGAKDFRGNLLGYTITVQADYALLKGNSGIFTFQKISVDGSDRITQIIEYSAGAVAGDLARKTTYSYTGGNKNADKMAQVPYMLTSGDLITPP